MLACAVTVNEKGELPMPEYGVALAVQNLVLQAVAEGLVAHQMGGFNRDGAPLVFALPADVRPVVMVALGALGSPDLLDEDRRAKELAPRRRLPLSKLAFTGEWGNPVF
jgi:nitroreductase